MSIRSTGHSKVLLFVNAVADKVSSLISIHNADSSAHSGILSNYLEKSQTSNKGKNVVVDGTSGNITFEDKPTIPSASSTTPSADTASGNIGSSTNYAKADHIHPQSSLYAESSHAHGNLTSDGKVGTVRSRFVVTTEGGALTTTSNYTTSNMAKVGHTHSDTEITPSFIETQWDSSDLASTINTNNPYHFYFYKYGPFKYIDYFFSTVSLSTTSTYKVNKSTSLLPSSLMPTHVTRDIVISASTTFTPALIQVDTDGYLKISLYAANKAVTVAGRLIYI